MARTHFVCGSTLLAFGIAMMAGCSSQPSSTAPETAAAATEEAAPHPEQALLDDLALGNRILARELDILDVQGHLTARSRVNPNHYYIARFLSPGGVTTSDFIENDLDSNPVHGPRNDQAREIYLHGEIFKARPDVMAVVHSHTPEFVAYGMTSVPLWSGDRMVPVWDIRPFNKGRNGIVSTPALGKAMAEKLGDNESVLLWGHGIALTGRSIAEAISRVDELRDAARLQQAAIATGNPWKPQPKADDEAAIARTWEYFKRSQLKQMGGRVLRSQPPDPVKPSDPVEATKRDLVLANRILASEELGVLDTFGHVSVRHPSNPNAYFVASAVSAGAVTAGDIVERDITKGDAGNPALSIHDEVYKARPDVKAVLYARTPEVLPFTGGIQLRPVVNGGAFIGNGLPIFTLGSLDAQRIAATLGKSGAVLLSGHGYVLTAGSIYNLADRAYQLRMNAKIQQQAMALRGKMTTLLERPAGFAAPEPPAQPAQQQGPGQQLGPPEGRAWVYWSQNVSVE